MSTTAGVFTETALQSVRLMVDEAMLDVNLRKDYQPRMETIKGIMAQQTARVTPLVDRSKDYTVEVEFDHACDITAASNVACEAGGVDLSTNVKSYTLSKNYMAKFDIDTVTYRTNDFDVQRQIAKGLLTADVKLVEQINKSAIAALYAARGVNSYNGGKGTVSGLDTNVIPAYWTAELIPYLEHVAVSNKFGQSVLINGANLFEAFRTAQYNAGNANGKGEANMFGSIELFWDIPTMDTESSAVVSYLVDRGAMFFASKAKYEDTMQSYTWGKTWTFDSQFMPGLKYDVLMKEACSSDFNKMSFKVMAHYDVLAAPTGCTSTDTGVLRFVNTAS